MVVTCCSNACYSSYALVANFRTNFGNTEFWEVGYHINKELGAMIADPGVSPWKTLWVLRCAAGLGSTVITSNLARVARMCDNSLTYFAQRCKFI